jgi:DNA (cytosine-5)-methyltransferase 1
VKHGSLFSGIGGFDLAAQWMGWENAFHCEIAEFPRKVLHHYWPNALSYENIKETDFTCHRGKIDVISGGFPCQPYSLAGKRLGKEDDRHLWPEMLRCIREIKPRWVVGENVFGIVNWNGGLVFDEVQSDLEAEGYEVQAYVLPACAVNAPHRRDRVWFVAYSNLRKRCRQTRIGQHDLCTSKGEEQNNNFIKTDKGLVKRDFSKSTPNPRSVGMSGQPTDPGTSKNTGQGRESVAQDGNIWNVRRWEGFPTTQPAIRRGDDGLSSQLDGITFSKWRNESIKAYGNAVVPQVVYQIFKAIEAYEPY